MPLGRRAGIAWEAEVDRVLEFCRRSGDTIFETKDLPYLPHISGCPPLLFVRGNPEALSEPSIAIVGSRRASSKAIGAGLRFARDLSAQGFTIVSGLALGVDAAAHRGALLAQGKTIGVLGHGLQLIYPARHYRLVGEILDLGGAVVTEFPPGVPPLPHHFPIRNRIIAGLSMGTLVVEARAKSGSLITARLAAEQGRDVFVLPGSFDDESYQGSFHLIQQGAKLVYDIEGILEEFPSQLPLRFDSPKQSPCAGVLPFFGEGGAASLSELVERSGWSGADVALSIENLKKQRSVVESFPGIYIALDK